LIYLDKIMKKDLLQYDQPFVAPHLSESPFSSISIQHSVTMLCFWSMILALMGRMFIYAVCVYGFVQICVKVAVSDFLLRGDPIPVKGAFICC